MKVLLSMPFGTVGDNEDDFDDENDYPLARFAHNDESNDTDDAPLAQFANRNQENDCDILAMISVDFGQVHCTQTSENTSNIVY